MIIYKATNKINNMVYIGQINIKDIRSLFVIFDVDNRKDFARALKKIIS